ncbi:iron ABC transporter permease [Sanguibacter sp. HDW7]|uniref:FecCD family ABC transporter permease n=1 Tax=Sanguibacter sp. HDW7 TaxID=2714931 RepID=UPI00140C001B|nr:iron ABC transporter permease [Sanguibacter sp. HDW7]QIK82930.1 iron ABC transporter permease [Sanguibacter sp. HDW7]
MTRTTAGVAVVLVVVAAAGLAVGSTLVAPGDVVRALLDPTASDPATVAVVTGLRLPRTVLGVVAGAALGLAGALTQVHTRNPLADPGLLGVTSGAGLAVVAGMAFAGLTSPGATVWSAVAGAAVAGALVLLVAGQVRAFGPVTTLVLTGAVTSALLGALTTAILLTHEPIMRSFQGWSTGALAGRPLDLLGVVAPLLVVGIALTFVNLPAWPGLALGDQVAAGLGRHVVADRVVGVCAVVALAAAATAIAGPVGFVGLLAPHVTRRFLPDAPVAAVLLAAPVGAALLVLADVVGRVAAPTGELPAGVAIAFVGAPAFVLVARAVTR